MKDLNEMNIDELDEVLKAAGMTKTQLRERQLAHLADRACELAIEAQKMGVTILGLLRSRQMVMNVKRSCRSKMTAE